MGAGGERPVFARRALSGAPPGPLPPLCGSTSRVRFCHKPPSAHSRRLAEPRNRAPRPSRRRSRRAPLAAAPPPHRVACSSGDHPRSVRWPGLGRSGGRRRSVLGARGARAKRYQSAAPRSRSVFLIDSGHLLRSPAKQNLSNTGIEESFRSVSVWKRETGFLQLGPPKRERAMLEKAEQSRLGPSGGPVLSFRSKRWRVESARACWGTGRCG